MSSWLVRPSWYQNSPIQQAAHAHRRTPRFYLNFWARITHGGLSHPPCEPCFLAPSGAQSRVLLMAVIPIYPDFLIQVMLSNRKYIRSRQLVHICTLVLLIARCGGLERGRGAGGAGRGGRDCGRLRLMSIICSSTVACTYEYKPMYFVLVIELVGFMA